MPFNPLSPLSINHKQYRGLEAQTIELNITTDITGPINVLNDVNWLTVSVVGVSNFVGGNPRTFNYNFQLNSQANNLPAGSYTATVVFRYNRDEPGFPLVREEFNVNLTVEETIQLSLSRTSIEIEYFIGAQAPAVELLQVATENAWSTTISDARVSLNQTNGSGTTDLQLSVDVAGLSVGNYNYEVLFDDGYDRLVLDVLVMVKNDNTAQDFLIIAPENFQFTIQEGETNPQSRDVTIESSQNFTISSNQPWLVPSSTNENAGVRTVTINTANTGALSPGTYTGALAIASSFSTQSIAVLLLVNETGSSGVINGTLYFAEDRDKITVASASSNRELVLEYNINSNQHALKKTVPFVNGVGKALLGDMANNLIEPNELFANFNNRVFSPVNPLSLIIEAFDKPLNSTQLNPRDTFDNIQLLPGATPGVTDRLTYCPSVLNTTPKGLVAFSFRADTAPTEIAITGDIASTIPVTGVTGPVYTCFIDLGQFSLTEGNVLTVTCGTFSVQVNIGAIAAEETHICWLNEWSVPEFATLRGHLTQDRPSSKVTGKYAEDGKEVTRVLEVRRPMEYQVNTGFITGDEYYQYFSSIIRAKKIWIYRGNTWEAVICNNNSLEEYRTRTFYRSYLLRFSRAAV